MPHQFPSDFCFRGKTPLHMLHLRLGPLALHTKLGLWAGAVDTGPPPHCVCASLIHSHLADLLSRAPDSQQQMTAAAWYAKGRAKFRTCLLRLRRNQIVSQKRAEMEHLHTFPQPPIKLPQQLCCVRLLCFAPHFSPRIGNWLHKGFHCMHICGSWGKSALTISVAFPTSSPHTNVAIARAPEDK